MRGPSAKAEQLIHEVVSLRQRLAEAEEAREQAEAVRRRTIEELAREDTHLKLLVETIPNLVWLKNVNGVYLACNPLFERLFNAKEAEIVGKTDHDFLDKEIADYVRDDDLKALASDKPTVKENWFPFPDGHRGLFETVKTVMPDVDGRIVGVLAIARDITEHHLAEVKLKESLADLLRSNEELEQFAYVASHDLQEPLRMVASYTQLLARRYHGRLDSDADEFIAFAVAGASRMQHLINDLLTYSRVGTRAKERQPIDCTAALDQAVAELQEAVEESGATVTRDPLPNLLADWRQMVQLFYCLVDNAIKFRSEEPPRIHVAAEQRERRWVFSVRDNGIGLDPRYAGRIFDIFQRLHSREEYSGTGIGLAICKKIVARHGGRIWVESQPGTGSTFYFSIS